MDMHFSSPEITKVPHPIQPLPTCLPWFLPSTVPGNTQTAFFISYSQSPMRIFFRNSDTVQQYPKGNHNPLPSSTE